MFQLFKRAYQLTGLHISDPQLNTSKTLGDLYGHLCAAAKPRPTALHGVIYVEGEKARRERAKQQAATQAPPRRRADLGDLIALGNVEIRPYRSHGNIEKERQTKIGQLKVINYALEERGLTNTQYRESKKTTEVDDHPLGLRVAVPKNLVEGTRAVPEFGKPLSSYERNLLVRETKKTLAEIEEEKLMY